VPIVIPRKRIYRTAAGGQLRVTKEEAAVLKALGLADDPPPVVAEPPKRVYKRRDLVAEAPAAAELTPQPKAVPPTPAPKPAAKPAWKPTFTDED
jgi:hypothetical protein